MPSRRYFISIAPIAHINGKLAPSAVRLPNLEHEDPEQDIQFYYGYKRRSSGERSLFGVRSKSRILEINPYTASELENRTLFTESLDIARANLQVAGNRELCQMEFEQQNIYRTLLGYAVAVVRANNAEWPERWTA